MTARPGFEIGITGIDKQSFIVYEKIGDLPVGGTQNPPQGLAGDLHDPGRILLI